jgi:hypothetical protein
MITWMKWRSSMTVRSGCPAQRERIHSSLEAGGEAFDTARLAIAAVLLVFGPRSFAVPVCKGRRSSETPRYHLAPESASRVWRKGWQLVTLSAAFRWNVRTAHSFFRALYILG